MAASSVTGVGQGSADKAGQKGSEHLFVGVEKLVGTRIVLSGAATITATTAEVTLTQNLPGVWNNVFNEGLNLPADATNVSYSDTIPTAVSDYLIFLTAYGSATVPYVSAISTSGPQTFTITGGAGTVFWQVVRSSNSSVSGPPYASAYPTHN